MSVRAKFTCTRVWQVTKYQGGDPEVYEVEFEAVSDDQPWSQWTPSGSLVLRTVNEGAVKQFEEGKDYYLDITVAE